MANLLINCLIKLNTRIRYWAVDLDSRPFLIKYLFDNKSDQENGRNNNGSYDYKLHKCVFFLNHGNLRLFLQKTKDKRGDYWRFLTYFE